MIDINLNNYEEKIIDYFDGKLNPLEIEQLMSFINEHPRIKEEFYIYTENEVVEVPENQLSHADKNNLKREAKLKQDYNSNFDELCIASIENDLSDKEKEWFNEIVANDINKENDFRKFRLTQMQADLSIVYPNKNELKRTAFNLKRIVITGISVAASVVILLGLYLTLSTKSTNYNKLVADQKVNATKTINEKVKEKIAEETISKERDYIKKLEPISDNRIATKNLSAKVKIEEIKTEKNIKKEYLTIAKIEPREMALKLNTKSQKIGIHTNFINYSPQVVKKEKTHVSLKTFLAQKINKAFFNKEKEKIEMFDIAQVGVKGINKIAGTEMTLERIYNKDGKIDKTQFTSKLIAFSTPAKN